MVHLAAAADRGLDPVTQIKETRPAGRVSFVLRGHSHVSSVQYRGLKNDQ